MEHNRAHRPTFGWLMHSLATIGTLLILELLLSADNAVVLAIIARRISNRRLQRRALNIGILLSFALRASVLFLAAILVNVWYLKLVGALYLLWLCVSHFALRGQAAPDSDATSDRDVRARFAQVVLALAFTDLVFAFDTILVAVAVTQNLRLIYTGVVLGMIGLRLSSGSVLVLLERYPALDDVAYLLIGWSGLKLGLEAVQAFGDATGRMLPVEMPDWVFWTGMAVLVVAGCLRAFRKAAADRTK